MVDVLVLEASAERRVGSSPTFRTTLTKTHTLWVFFLTADLPFEGNYCGEDYSTIKKEN